MNVIANLVRTTKHIDILHWVSDTFDLSIALGEKVIRSLMPLGFILWGP